MKLRRPYKLFLIAGIVAAGILLVFRLILPDPLFNDPCSTVIEDRNGTLLGAHIAGDGQWRFPYKEDVPVKFSTCLLAFEDRHFYEHPGVNPVSLIRALRTNIGAGKVVEGGSTLSMQLIRLSRRGKPRTVREKLIEMGLAIALELKYSKSEILAMYATYAPFGGNVVGVETASWRYFRRPAEELSWSEAATLAVLPNAPALIYPGKNQWLLLEKRNRLLSYLLLEGVLDSLTFSLACEEPLPGKPAPLVQAAPHLLQKVNRQMKGERVQTTVDEELQKAVNNLVLAHHARLKHNKIFNAAVLVVEVERGEILAYVGNAVNGNSAHGNRVDMIDAPRSSGSILKPVLYAATLEAGQILPGSLVEDVPTRIGSFNPMNFNRTYSGAVPAKNALSRSLNVPAVKMLQVYGVPRFKSVLQQVGITTIRKPADHYGLSLILGGAEVTMGDLAAVYSSFSRVLNHYYAYNGRYNPGDYSRPSFLPVDRDLNNTALRKRSFLSAASIYSTYDALLEVNRPHSQIGWESFSSSRKLAWKTGTSFGFRDAWAVGTTPRYVVLVWVGNADGEGRPGLTGTSCAAPLLFDVFNLLPGSEWFDPPYDEMVEVEVCRESGYRAGPWCGSPDSVLVPGTGLKTDPCPYHQLVHLDPERKFQVTDRCFDPSEMVHDNWFVLPPVVEWYYKQQHSGYKSLPPISPECMKGDPAPMDFVYPIAPSKLYVPVNLQGQRESVVLELVHREEAATVYWYLDEAFLGQTRGEHRMAVQPTPGSHHLVVVDQSGRQLRQNLEVLDEKSLKSGN